jgi:hypothetical protein
MEQSLRQTAICDVPFGSRYTHGVDLIESTESFKQNNGKGLQYCFNIESNALRVAASTSSTHKMTFFINEHVNSARTYVSAETVRK